MNELVVSKKTLTKSELIQLLDKYPDNTEIVLTYAWEHEKYHKLEKCRNSSFSEVVHGHWYKQLHEGAGYIDPKLYDSIFPMKSNKEG
jgi:hypothetical protein